MGIGFEHTMETNRSSGWQEEQRTLLESASYIGRPVLHKFPLGLRLDEYRHSGWNSVLGNALAFSVYPLHAPDSHQELE